MVFKYHYFGTPEIQIKHSGAHPRVATLMQLSFQKKKKNASIPSVVHRLRPSLSTDRYTSRYNVIVDTTKTKYAKLPMKKYAISGWVIFFCGQTAARSTQYGVVRSTKNPTKFHQKFQAKK